MPHEATRGLLANVAFVPALHDGVQRCVSLATSASQLVTNASADGTAFSHRIAFDPKSERFYDATMPGVADSPAIFGDVSALFGAKPDVAEAIKRFMARYPTQIPSNETAPCSHETWDLRMNLQSLSRLLRERYVAFIDVNARTTPAELRDVIRQIT